MFTIKIQSKLKLNLQVFDKDSMRTDDFLGECEVNWINCFKN